MINKQAICHFLILKSKKKEENYYIKEKTEKCSS